MTAEQIEKAIEKIRPERGDINGWIVVEYKDLEIIRNTIGKLADENKRLKENKNKAIEYIMTNLISEWDIENGGNVSGSDLPVDAITPILDSLLGSDEK